MRDKFQKIENHWLWVWIKNNVIQLTLIGAIFAWTFTTFLLPLFTKHDKDVHADTRPKVKIVSVSYKGQLYQDSSTTQSEALNFFIALRDEGDANAYDVQIKKKMLGLPRGKFDLKEPSLQTLLTSTCFDLPERKIETDSIFIDESHTNMQKVRNGEIPITLEYEIIYYGDKYRRGGSFIYKYKNSTTDGVFDEDTAEESLNLKL